VLHHRRHLIVVQYNHEQNMTDSRQWGNMAYG
jgi:hypothetical protein